MSQEHQLQTFSVALLCPSGLPASVLKSSVGFPRAASWCVFAGATVSRSDLPWCVSTLSGDVAAAAEVWLGGGGWIREALGAV